VGVYVSWVKTVKAQGDITIDSARIETLEKLNESFETVSSKHSSR